MVSLIPVSCAESVTGFPWITRNNPGLVEFSRVLLMPYEGRAVTSDKKKKKIKKNKQTHKCECTQRIPNLQFNIWKASTVVRLLRMTQKTNELDYSNLLTCFLYKSELLKEFVSFLMWQCFKQPHTYVRRIEGHRFNVVRCKSLTWPVWLRSTFVTISAYERSQNCRNTSVILLSPITIYTEQSVLFL